MMETLVCIAGLLLASPPSASILGVVPAAVVIHDSDISVEAKGNVMWSTDAPITARDTIEIWDVVSGLLIQKQYHTYNAPVGSIQQHTSTNAPLYAPALNDSYYVTYVKVEHLTIVNNCPVWVFDCDREGYWEKRD